MKHTLNLIKISLKSLLRRNNGNKLLLAAICILTLVPMFLYNTTNSIITTVKEQNSIVYGIYDEIYYRDKISDLSTFTDDEFESLLPNYRYQSYGVFYTADTIALEGNKNLNLGFADAEAIRLGCITVKEGRFPEGDNEIALTEGIANELGANGVGQEVTIDNQTYTLCGIVNDFGRLWPRGEKQIEDNITPVNAFITQSRLEQVFDKSHSITQQIVIEKEAGIVNPNDDTLRLFKSNGSFDASDNFSIPQSFMILMYVISLLIVITILIMNKTRLLARIRNYLLLGMNKRDIFFVLVFETVSILILGVITGGVFSFFVTKGCLNLILDSEYSAPIFDFNMTLNVSLILSLLIGLAIVFIVYAIYVVKQTALDSEISGRHYKNTNAKINIFKLDMFKNRKAIIAIVLLISLSCTLLSYGIALAETIPNTPEGVILESVLEGFAEYYSLQLSQNIRRGQAESAEKCQSTGGNRPMGYLTGPDKRFILDPDTAPTVKMIFDMYAAGQTVTEIITYLNDMGLHNRKGKKFTKNSLYAILNNEKYTGVYIYKDKRIEGGMPRIVDDDTFWKVQELLKTNKRAPAHKWSRADYILTDKLFCGKCGSGMIGESGTSKTGAKHNYYICAKKKREKACDKKAVKQALIEDLVIQSTIDLLSDDELLEFLIENTWQFYNAQDETQEELDALSRQLEQTEAAIENLIRAIEAGILNSATKKRMDELEAQQKELITAIADREIARNFHITREYVDFFFRQFRDKDYTDRECQKQLVATFINSVFVYDDYIKINYNFSSDSRTITLTEANEADVEGENDAISEDSTTGGVFVHRASCSTKK